MLKAIAALPSGESRVNEERALRMRTRSRLANLVRRAKEEAGSDPVLAVNSRRIEARVTQLDQQIARDMR
jgi:hypothetical protein